MARRCRLQSCRQELPKVKDSDRWQKAGSCNADHYYQHEAEKRTQKAANAKDKKPRAKAPSISKVREELAVLLQKLVRMKAADESGYCECVTCKKRFHWKEMQGGHFIERGKIGTKTIEENINPQCHYCNHYGMKKASCVLDYKQWMIDMHGADYVEWLRQEARRVVKHSRQDLEGQIVEVLGRIKEQSARLNE